MSSLTTNPLPAGYCAAKAKANLNVQQWIVLHATDKATADYSWKKVERFSRQLALHVAACPTCSNLPENARVLAGVPQLEPLPAVGDEVVANGGGP